MAFEPLNLPARADAPPLEQLLHAAAQRRRRLFERTDAVRLFDGAADPERDARAGRCLAGAVIERLGDYAVLHSYDDAAFAAREQIAAALLGMGAHGVYLKVRQRADLRHSARQEIAPKAPLLGQPAPERVIVTEDGMRLGVRLDDGLSTGLFLDQRDNRLLVRESCREQRVLNLFCYAGSFSVAAGLGGAAQVTSVDLSAAALQRVDENLRLNQLPKAQHRLLKADARRWLERAQGRGDRFDWIVLDPPSFASVKGQAFSVERDYGQLVHACARLLAPGGRLLAVLNHRKTSEGELHRIVRAGATAACRPARELHPLLGAEDCASQGESATKSVLLTLAT